MQSVRSRSAQQFTPTHRSANLVFAWFVHFYTACGIVAAFLATLAVIGGRYRDAFVWLAVSTFLDATDGVLARLASVKETLPGFDGARLDDIIDYLTFVFVPVLLLHQAGALPPGWGLAVACAVLLSSGYGFASLDAKTSDHFFTGFPSYWNIVALYLFAFRLSPVVNGVILAALCVLVFVRIGYVYPSRTPTLRGLTVALGSVWALMMIAVIALLPAPPRVLVTASLFFPIYYTVLSFVLWQRREARR
jgi:phosphatidylcholine synthase